MNLDDPVCLCFRVSRRKLEAYIRIHQPRVASQLSQCGGAGTGCGWCVPFLKQLFLKASTPGESLELDRWNAEEYAAQRSEYLREGKGTPPPSATPGDRE